ncbi:MAG: phage tail tape measure protein [Pseudomonadota bacterium]
MSDQELRTAVILDLTGNLDRRAAAYGDAIDRLSRRGQRQFGVMARSAYAVGDAMDKMAGRFTAGLTVAGSAWKGYQQVKASAGLDKDLIQVQQTAGATTKMAAMLRKELFAMAKETGRSVDSLLAGFNSLIQSGQTWEEALVTLQAINPTMAVTSAQAETLAGALGVASEAFQFDLSQPGLAVKILDQMTIAGRLGNAELEDLSSIFGKVGVNARSAGLDFASTLGFIEQLSMIERNPEKLATLADSTLRLFTNQRYMQAAARATGVKFYDANGERRAAFDVLGDISARYRTLQTDVQRDRFINRAFGNADLDTIKGLRSLLAGDTIGKAREMTREIAGAGGTIGRDLDAAINNAVDQVGRLKAALREAADEFAQPVNDAVKGAIKYLMDERGLSGKEMIGMGAIGALGLFGAVKGGGKLLKGLSGVGAGVAAGKALEEMAGVQPVFVVNMPGGGFGGMGGPGAPGGFKPGTFGGWKAGAGMLFGAKDLASIRLMGAGAMATSAGLVAAAGAAGYGVGTLINKQFVEGTAFGDALGEGIARVLAALGNDSAQAAIEAQQRYEAFTGKVEIEVKAADGAKADVTRMESVGGELEAGVRWGGP